MTESSHFETITITETAKKKPFFLNKKYIIAATATAVVAGASYYLLKNNVVILPTPDNVLIERIDNVLTITEIAE